MIYDLLKTEMKRRCSVPGISEKQAWLPIGIFVGDFSTNSQMFLVFFALFDKYILENSFVVEGERIIYTFWPEKSIVWTEIWKIQVYFREGFII